MIKCFNSNIQIYSDGNYNYNNWNLINKEGTFNILNNTSNRIDFCILQSGNTGIGSSAPRSKLDVIGDVSILGQTTITSNLILVNTLLTAPIAQYGTNANATSNIYLIGGARSRLGIGSASPTVALDVVGSANISGLITANGGLTIPTGKTLNVVDGLTTISIDTTTVNTRFLNITETITANGGIITPYGYAIIADGGIYTTSLNATDVITATQGLIVSAGSLLTANGGITATAITASGLISANNGLSIPTGKSLIANGGIITTTIETSNTLRVLSTTATAPIVQYGTNASAANNLYFIGGGRARIGIGSSSPTVALDVLGAASISGTVSANTINASAAISANSIASTTTILAGELITANGGITVPLGKQVIADGGITATTISASGLITATNGIQANTINTTGAVNTNGGIISGSTITSSGLITANAGLTASTITSLGIINAAAGISATTINATSAITGTTLEMSGLIKTAGGLDTTSIIASGLISANSGITASSMIAGNASTTTPIAQYGTNTNAASNIYIAGGGNARIGVGSASPTVALDVAGDTKISGALLAASGITTTTISASQLITANNGISATTLDVSNNIIVKSAIATIPITQIGDNASANSNLYFVGGGRARVGIGSSSPNNALDIIGDTDITGIYKKNNRDVILDTSNYILATSNIIVKRLGEYLPYTWIINSQSFNLNYTLGNVGIGTTDPIKKLHIMHPSGELVRIETNAEGANQVSGIEFGVPSYNTASRSKITSSTYAGSGGSGGSGDSGGSDLQFSTASGANSSSLKLIISPIGNVGIGTPTPNNILQIGNAGRLRIANNTSDYTILGTADTDDTTNTKIELSGNTRSGSAGASGTISYVATNTDGYHKFITNSTAERVRITASGNVGIGTTNPEQLLTLYGNNARLKIRNSAAADATANKSVAIHLDNEGDKEWIISNSNNSLAFAYNDGIATSNRIIIDGVSGNIGISTNPSSNYILNIVGNIKVAGNIIPNTSNAFDLGSSLNKWKNLYLSGDSIYLDDLVLSRGSNISLNIKDVRGNYRDINLSNINLYNNSNKLTIGIDVDGNIVYSTSNKIYYPLTTPNINNTAILDNVNDIIIGTSNYAIHTSNKLTNIITTLDNNASNYILTTNNTISQRITDLTTDMINENQDAAKKFIINNYYDNSLLINGSLTVNSNLIVLGESTQLDTIVYNTERLEIVNENNMEVALMIQQRDTIRDIFVASNINTEVFKITNNGDINIQGIYKKDNRDVFLDTSNYIQTTSNNLINYGIMNDNNSSNYIASTSNILYNNIAYLDVKFKLLTLKVNLNEATANDYIQTTSNNLINKVRENDENSSNYISIASKNASNYILTASNNLINKVRENDENSSNYILTASNNLINKVKENDENSSNYILTASNNLINKVRENDENSSNYILTASNNLINKVRENDENASNYILTASNNLINKVRENDENVSNYILTASNNLINKVKENDENASNYILTASNNLINKVRENDENASNYILTASNNLINKVRENDENASNYILTASNNLINKVRENDENSSNYILTASNNLINKVRENDENSSNYISIASKNASNYILTASNNLINKVRENDENSSNYISIASKNASNYILTASNNLINKVRENDNNSSNYILTASNNLINKVRENDNNSSNYILTASNNLINKVKENDENASNYILTASNNLINKVRENDENASNYILTASNNLINKVRENDENASNYILTASNNLINKVKENDENASNYILTASNNLINKVRENDNNSSNYILTASNNLINKVKENEENASNYILTASNNLINKVRENDDNSSNYISIASKNASNYILTASNNLINKVRENDENASNYILTASNNLINKVKENDENASNYISIASKNASNYILTASNNLINKVRENDENSSNYILTASNNLINKVKENDENSSNYISIASKNASNYILTASNNLINKVKENDENSSNFVLITSNILSNRLHILDQLTSNIVNNSISTLNIKVRENDNNASNYVLSTNNIISQRITNLTTDMITENENANNKFIVNNRYNNSLEINGSLTINSNLIVLGDTTQLDTIVYTTERLEIVNANNTTTALMVQQNSANSDIFVASNISTAVFKIANNGDVLINGNGVYKRNNRDVILDTSNYILTASNNLINKVRENDDNSSNYISIASKNASNYILTASNNLINKIRENDDNSSNYISIASKNASNYILTASNNLINKVRENDDNSSNYISIASKNASNYILTASNNLVNKVRENDDNSSNYISIASKNASNYILTASNNLINKVRENDDNSSNFVLSTSNLLSERLRILDLLTSNIVNNSISTLNTKVRENDDNSSNFVLSTSNLLSERLRILDLLTSNIVNNSISTLNTKVRENDENSSNFVLSTSNLLSERLRILDLLTSNIVNNSISTLNTKVRENDENSSNYISIASKNSSNYILTASNNLINKVRENDDNSSNFVLSTSNLLSERLRILDLLTSNIVNNSISTLNTKVRENDENSSNFVLSTSNFISQRITDLTTDMITENESAINKFIVNNRYNNNLEVNGSLTVNSNLIVLGDTTQLQTIVYTTERLEVVNANNTTTALMIQQNSPDSDIFVASNMNSAVFKIANNGDVLINGNGDNGVYKRNNRDVILDTSNYVLTTSNNLINKVRENDENSSNFVLSTSNLLSERLHILDLLTSNIVNNSISTLNTKVRENDENSSNFVLSTSNLLSERLRILDLLTSNIVNNSISTLNTKVRENDENSSNFVLSTSNLLSERLRILDLLTSNIVNNSISTLNTKVRENDDNSSNFVLSTSNLLSERLHILDLLTSNIVNNSISTLNTKVRENDDNSSNFVLSTSNFISQRITDLTTDMITENENAVNKFIVNNRYNNNLEINGTLTVNSNLIVLGDTTQLDTVVYTTERLEVVNANNTSCALMVQQNSPDSDIFVASNMNSAVFKIANNGDVLITGGSDGSGGVYKRNNRDVILDTSNYVLTTSNNLINKVRENDDNSSNYVSSVKDDLIYQITQLNNEQQNYVLATSSNLGDGLTEVIYTMNVNNRNASNYILATSNIIQQRINEITTDKITEGEKNKFIIEDRYNSNLEINGRLVVNSNLIVNSLATMRNSLDITGNVNFTGELYKNGMIYPNGKTYTGSSSILSQFSPIQMQFTMYKNVVEKTGSGWQFIDNNINVVDDKVQGFCVRIKPNHYSSKILINLNCHIGIDYGTDARWWGLRLYRKIGEAGEWTHITEADGTGGDGSGSDGSGASDGTSCWLSHNLGAETSTSSYFIANVSGAYYDVPVVDTAEAIAATAAGLFVYYTVKWCSLLGDNTQDGKLYLNRPAVINALNAAIVSSSWNVSEIWQLETSYFPKGGIVTKYTPTQTQFSIYKDVVEKMSGGWDFIDNNISIINNNIQGFCVRIRPNHYTSKILINLNCHIGIDYGTDARWWGLRLYRKIGEAGEWAHITDADGTGSAGVGTTCWLSHNLGAEASTYSYFIANVSGAYYDTPNVMDTYVYYTAKWCSQLGDVSQNGKLYLNRPATYNVANTSNTAVLSSSWNAQEIWQRETTFIPKNAVICQNMSIQTLFNIYRNIVVKTGGGWQFIDNNTSIISDKIQGFCVRIKPTHISSKVLVHLSCHIGIDYGTDARWWGLRLYRKIGEAGAWAHITEADGNNLIDNKGTSCWLSHNLGAEASTSSYFVANISGSFFDLPATSTEFVYYTAMWCSQLGDNTQDGKIYLNRPATYNEGNSAVLSSSWNAQEIWQLGTPYEPTEYSIINIFNNNNVGIGTTNPICKLDVNGTINAINYSTISDRRYKKDIRGLDSSLELINRLLPVSYLTIDQNEGDKRNYGFIAQDLHKVIPEAVNVPANDSNNYTIEYMSLIPLLTKSIQDLTETVGRQQKTIDDLTARLDRLDRLAGR